MPKINIQGFFQRFYRLISSFVILVIFFTVYNVFLIDQTLESMRFSLEQATAAYSIEDLDGLDMLITGAITEEIEPASIDSMSVSNLEYAKDIATRGKSFRQIKDMKMALGVAIEKMEEERGVALSVIDTTNRYIKSAVSFISSLPQRYIREGEEPPEKRGAEGIELYRKARELELKAKLQEAITEYESFTKQFPRHQKIPLVKLRLAYTYQKSDNNEKAGALYSDIIRSHPLTKEADIARIQIYRITQEENARRKANELLIEAAELPQDNRAEKQEIFYKIGVLNTKVLDLDEAGKFYRRAREINPGGAAARKARFNAAWVEKEKYNLDVSAKEFMELSEEGPEEGVAVDSRYQVANIYQREGKYEDAIQMYLNVAEDYKDHELSSFCLFQAGASYLYDLNDQEKADEIFARLKDEHPGSPYTDFTSTETPVGLFLTFIVPRATRLVTWRGSGLMVLSGYAGEIVKFKAQAKEENFNKAFRDWLKVELPDTVGNIWMDIQDTDFDFKKDKAGVEGHIVMGKFEVDAEAAGYLKKTETDSIRLVVTRAVLEKIPIPPIFVNMALSGVLLIVEKYFPITVTDITMYEDVIYIEGFGGERILNRIKESADNLFDVDIAMNRLSEPARRKEMYDLYNEKFPWSSFSETREANDAGGMFYDFFTRMSMYAGFKMLETVKDSKLDYHRSIRTFGKLDVKKEKFEVSYTEKEVNSSMTLFVLKEFPWIVEGKDLFDVKGLEFDFHDNGDITMEGYLSIGKNIELIKDASDLRISGLINIAIDEESGVPYFNFKNFLINRRPFPIEKLNALSLVCLDIMKDGHIPLKVEDVRISDGLIVIRGEGAEDFVGRVFSRPHLFEIFYIRAYDLYVAGIQRIRPIGYSLADRWMKNLPGDELERLLKSRSPRKE